VAHHDEKGGGGNDPGRAREGRGQENDGERLPRVEQQRCDPDARSGDAESVGRADAPGAVLAQIELASGADQQVAEGCDTSSAIPA
jgi:hypothetical protein